jgi:hypothetical protein
MTGPELLERVMGRRAEDLAADGLRGRMTA